MSKFLSVVVAGTVESVGVVGFVPLLLLITADVYEGISADLVSAQLTLLVVVLVVPLLPAPNRNGLFGGRENPTVLLLPLGAAEPKPENEENKPVPDDTIDGVERRLAVIIFRCFIVALSAAENCPASSSSSS